MILTVTPNANVDKTYRIENFALDRVHRPSQATRVAGGKGVNLARVYQTLGGKAVATGYLGGANGRVISQSLQEEGIEARFVRVSGESRTCIAIIDPIHGTQTEVNELGPQTTPRHHRALVATIDKLLSQYAFRCVILSGSLPPGAPSTLYADLIAHIQKRAIPVALDASGEALCFGVQAKPWLVKPNRVELEAILGKPVRNDAEILEAAHALHHGGIAIVAATRGADGAYLVASEGAWEAVPPSIEFASAVASGDSFLAAFLWQWFHGTPAASPEQALRLATGAGAANAAVIGAGFCSQAAIYAQADRATLRRLS